MQTPPVVFSFEFRSVTIRHNDNTCKLQDLNSGQKKKNLISFNVNIPPTPSPNNENWTFLNLHSYSTFIFLSIFLFLWYSQFITSIVSFFESFFSFKVLVWYINVQKCFSYMNKVNSRMSLKNCK